jgi:hypothetical protein
VVQVEWESRNPMRGLAAVVVPSSERLLWFVFNGTLCRRFEFCFMGGRGIIRSEVVEAWRLTVFLSLKAWKRIVNIKGEFIFEMGERTARFMVNIMIAK